VGYGRSGRLSPGPKFEKKGVQKAPPKMGPKLKNTTVGAADPKMGPKLGGAFCTPFFRILGPGDKRPDRPYPTSKYSQTIQGTSQNEHHIEQHKKNTQHHKKCIEQQQQNWEECGPCPVFAGITLAFALQLRKKHGKTSVRVVIHKHSHTIKIHKLHY
jgi:hypothetical protein